MSKIFFTWSSKYPAATEGLLMTREKFLVNISFKYSTDVGLSTSC